MIQAQQITAMEEFWRGHIAALDEPLRTVCRYAMEGGRRVRAGLLLAAAPEAGVDGVRAAVALEMMHTATLLQDDIFDGAHLRRGQTAVHARFGKAAAILASDWLLLTALELAAETGPVYFRSLSGAGKAMAQAEAAELAASMPGSYADAERMGEEIARGKTGRLFGAALCGAAAVRGAAEPVCKAWEQLGTAMGVTYQMVDDCLDVYACEESCGKSVGHDAPAGCMTLPMLLGAFRLQGPDATPGCLEDGRSGSAACAELMRSVRSVEVRERMAEVIQQRMQSHCREAQRVGFDATAWDVWSQGLLRRAADCLHDFAEQR